MRSVPREAPGRAPSPSASGSGRDCGPGRPTGIPTAFAKVLGPGQALSPVASNSVPVDRAVVVGFEEESPAPSPFGLPWKL